MDKSKKPSLIVNNIRKFFLPLQIVPGQTLTNKSGRTRSKYVISQLPKRGGKTKRKTRKNKK